MAVEPLEIPHVSALTDNDERMASAVHIVCAVFNGAAYLAQFISSLRQQTVPNWLLWLRDDGSTDDSAAVMAQLAAEDERIRVLHSAAAKLGVVGSFNWLLQQVPAAARYIMFADQDDVWLPVKIEYSLSAMILGEESYHGPLLVHTDMAVVNEDLTEIHPSFWHFAHLDPEPATLQRLAVHNVVTGATVMINRPLRELVRDIPPEAAMHDAWIACVASAFGRIMAVATPTMLYRQHPANAIGARVPVSALGAAAVAKRAATALGQAEKLHAHVNRLAKQAGAFVHRYGNALTPADKAFLTAYAAIPGHGLFRRKLDIARLHLRPEFGWLRNAGWLLRA